MHGDAMNLDRDLDRDLEPELPKSDPWAPADPSEFDSSDIQPSEEQLAEEAEGALLDDDPEPKPTEGCLICTKTGGVNFKCEHPDAHIPLETENQDANGEPAPYTNPGLTLGEILFGQGPDMITGQTIEDRSGHPFGSDKVNDATGEDPKRVKQRLRELGQEALDRLYDERIFNSDPRFKVANEGLSGSEPPNEEQSKVIFDSLMEQGMEAFVEYATKSLRVPIARRDAVTKYIEYRTMVEVFS